VGVTIEPGIVDLRPNGLAFSGRLEGTTLIDRGSVLTASGSQNRPDGGRSAATPGWAATSV